MDAAARQMSTLLELDARHDDLLRRLDELDKRVTKVLADYQPIVKTLGYPHEVYDISEGELATHNGCTAASKVA